MNWDYFVLLNDRRTLKVSCPKSNRKRPVGPELCDQALSRKRRQFGLKSIFRPCIYHELFFLGVWGPWLVFHCACSVCLRKFAPEFCTFSSLDVCSLSISDVSFARSGHAGCGIWPDLRAASPWSWWQVRREKHADPSKSLVLCSKIHWSSKIH